MPVLTRGTITSGPVPLAYLDSGGDGSPLVFLHGAMGWGACWARVMTALAPQHRCIALDQRGHGRSAKPRHGYQREDFVTDLQHAVDALGLTSFALIGHSTGALNAWVYAARHPERVTALVIEDMHAAGRGPAEVEGWRTWLDSWPLPFPTTLDLTTHFARLRPSLADYFAEVFEEREDGWWPLFSSQTIIETIQANETRDWWDELAAVVCPTLVVKGGESDYVSLAEAERMAGTVRQGRLAVVPGANHTVHVDQPEAYVKAVSAFLAQSLGEGPAPSSLDWDDARLEALARAQYTCGDADLPLDPRRTALLLIDMQEEFVTFKGGPYRVPEAGRRIPAMAALLQAFRARSLPVLHTAFAASHAFLDRPRWGSLMPNRALGSGFDDSALFQDPRFVPELEPRLVEGVIHKPSYGAFYDTPLQTILKRLGVDTLVLAGTLTDCCVGTTARQAYERGLAAYVVSDATATSLPEMHAAELRILRRSFARVVSTHQVIELLNSPVGAWHDTASSRRSVDGR